MSACDQKRTLRQFGAFQRTGLNRYDRLSQSLGVIMRRRDFTTLLGGAAAGGAMAGWPVAVFAQPPMGRPLAGVLSPQSAASSTRNIAAMRAGLIEAGFIEGKSVWLEIRHADGVSARLATLAAELIARKPDVIFAGSAPALVAVGGMTQTIPI